MKRGTLEEKATNLLPMSELELQMAPSLAPPRHRRRRRRRRRQSSRPTSARGGEGREGAALARLLVPCSLPTDPLSAPSASVDADDEKYIAIEVGENGRARRRESRSRE